MNFALFILLNAALFIRPAEVTPGLAIVPIYEILILSCSITCMSALIRDVSVWPISERPVTLCVLGMLVAIVLSLLARSNAWGARVWGLDFGKVLLYYLLLTSAVNTPARLRRFLFWLAVMILALTGLALLQFHKVINIPALEALERTEIDPKTGEIVTFLQLVSTGIFNDPNDLSLILVVGMAISVYLSHDRAMGGFRVAWWAPFLVFGYALVLTRSRGGILTMLAASLSFMLCRFGWKRSIPLALVALPAMLLVFGGRQARISTGEDTAQQRIELWRDGLYAMRRSPLFGIGRENFADEMGLVAHNSYVHSYTELGLVGGTFFVGAYYFAIRILYRLGPRRVNIVDPELARLRPYLMAIVVGYAVGLYSLSRNYVTTTYLIPGLAEVYQRVATTQPPAPPLRMDGRRMRDLALAGIVALVGINVFIRIF